MTSTPDSPPTPVEPRWLDPEEAEIWLDLWSVCLWLPSRLDAQLRHEAGMSHPEYNAISQLSMAPGHTLRMRELATVGNMSLSHLSRVVSRLEARGWVERRPDPTDGRSTYAALTEAGWAAVREAAPGHVEAVRRLVFDPLTDEQRRALGEAAKAMVAALGPPAQGRA